MGPLVGLHLQDVDAVVILLLGHDEAGQVRGARGPLLVRVGDLLGLPGAEPGGGEHQGGQGEGEPAPVERQRGGGQRLRDRPGRLQGQRPLPPGEGEPVDDPGGGERGGHG